MKRQFIYIFPLLCLLQFCDSTESANFDFEATVVGQGMDCGDMFLIDLVNLTGEDAISNGRYYADDLPERYKIQGMEIKLNCRFPNEDELYACTTFGSGFSHVYVLELKAKER